MWHSATHSGANVRTRGYTCKTRLTQGRERVCGLGLMHTQPTYIVCVMTLLKTVNLLWRMQADLDLGQEGTTSRSHRP